MADTYDVTIRFECHEPALAAAVVNQLILCLRPAPDGTALVQNPRLWAVEAIGGTDGQPVIRDSREFDLAYRCASTSTRDRAFHFVHSGYIRSGSRDSA